MLYASGSYTGNGSSQTISGIAFTPELIIIRANGTTGTPRCIFRTASHSGDKTSHTVGALGNFAGGITSIGANQFSVGSDAAANGNTLTYHWIAFAKNGKNDFDYGTYAGNGSAGTTVSVTTFDPDFVVVKHDGTERGCWKVTGNGTNSMAFENLANSSLTTSITALGTSGANNFTIGAGVRVNSSGQNYYWFAFKAVTTQFAVGSYTGNGTSQSVSGLGFAVVNAWVKPDFTDNGGQKFPTDSSNVSYPDFGNSTGITTGITSFNSDGFSVGSNAVFNNNTKTIYYAAWGVPINTLVKTINGLAKSSVKTVDGLAIASVKTWNGLS